ncbi:hypothetical protein CRM22_011360 [Opisthorchis felineus]|uniref:C2HC/C3H-type domain-containing protein n=1 Tax=Opisthorchis felineus TaxID=147828 RepID=A0A4S2JRX3_OPIFE|nr:hypothetical protein CRM22_011360 [Opisthorchis felineus]
MELETRVPCGSCSRQFFATSLPKHEAYCRKSRKIIVNKAGGDGTNVVKHTEDYQKISPFLSSMSDLLRLGKERRQRWRARHNEFQAILRHSRGEQMDFQEPAVNAGIVTTSVDQQTCEYCGRSFNEAAFRKHVIRCEEVHNRLWSNGANSPEHADATRRFKARMNYKPTLQRGNRTQVNATDSTEETVYSSAISHPSNYPTPTSSITLNELSMENYSGQTGSMNVDVIKPVVEGLSWNAVEQLSNCNHLLVHNSTVRSQQAKKMKDRPDTSIVNSGLEDSWDSNRLLTVLQDYTLKPTLAQDADSLPHYSSPSQTSSLSTVSLLKFSDNEPIKQDTSKTMASTVSLARCPWSPTVSSFAEGRFQPGEKCLVLANGLLTKENLAKPALSDAESQTAGKRDYSTLFTTHKKAEINISHSDVLKRSFIPTLPPEKLPSGAFPVGCREQDLTDAARKASHSVSHCSKHGNGSRAAAPRHQHYRCSKRHGKLHPVSQAHKRCQSQSEQSSKYSKLTEDRQKHSESTFRVGVEGDCAFQSACCPANQTAELLVAHVVRIPSLKSPSTVSPSVEVVQQVDECAEPLPADRMESPTTFKAGSMTRKAPKETTEPTHTLGLSGDFRPRVEGKKATPAVPLYPVVKSSILKGAGCVSEFSKTVPTPKRELRTQDLSGSNSEVNSRPMRNPWMNNMLPDKQARAIARTN